MSRLGYPKVTDKLVSYQGTFIPFGGGPQVGTVSSTYRSHFIDKIGSNTVGWPAVIHDNNYLVTESHLDVVDPHYDGVKTNGDRSFGTWPFARLPGGQLLSTGREAFQSDIDYATALIYNLTVDKLIDRIKDQKINIGQFIAERQQLIGLVGSTARRLASTMMALRRGNFPHAINSLFGNRSSRTQLGRVAGGIPEQWLALKYGWQPLLGDIDGACKELAALSTLQPPVLYAKAKVKLQLPPRTVDYVTSNSQDPNIRWARTQGEISSRGFLQFKLSSSFGQGLSRTGLINPYALAWELLPYSFVVDWMIPVGSFLNRLDYETGLVFDRGHVSHQVKESLTARILNPKVVRNGWTQSWSGLSASLGSFGMQRRVFSAAPLPTTPYLKNPFSLTHTANALSLLAVAFDRPKGLFDFLK